MYGANHGCPILLFHHEADVQFRAALCNHADVYACIGDRLEDSRSNALSALHVILSFSSLVGGCGRGASSTPPQVDLVVSTT